MVAFSWSAQIRAGEPRSSSRPGCPPLASDIARWHQHRRARSRARGRTRPRRARPSGLAGALRMCPGQRTVTIRRGPLGRPIVGQRLPRSPSGRGQSSVGLARRLPRVSSTQRRFGSARPAARGCLQSFAVGPVRTTAWSPWGPNRCRISTASASAGPNQWGSLVSNSATSPGRRVISRSPRMRRSSPAST